MAGSEGSKSIGWVVVMLVLAVAAGTWCFLAADYFQEDPSETAQKVNVFVNAIEQIPNFLSVMRHAFANRLWVLVLFGIVEVGVLGLGVVLKKVEGELEGKSRPSARKR